MFVFDCVRHFCSFSRVHRVGFLSDTVQYITIRGTCQARLLQLENRQNLLPHPVGRNLAVSFLPLDQNALTAKVFCRPSSRARTGEWVEDRFHVSGKADAPFHKRERLLCRVYLPAVHVHWPSPKYPRHSVYVRPRHLTVCKVTPIVLFVPHEETLCRRKRKVIASPDDALDRHLCSIIVEVSCLRMTWRSLLWERAA